MRRWRFPCARGVGCGDHHCSDFNGFRVCPVLLLGEFFLVVALPEASVDARTDVGLWNRWRPGVGSRRLLGVDLTKWNWSKQLGLEIALERSRDGSRTGKHTSSTGGRSGRPTYTYSC